MSWKIMAGVALSSAILALLLYYLSGSSGLLPLLFLVAASALLSSQVLLLRHRLLRIHNKSKAKEEFARIMESVQHYRSKGFPLLGSLEKLGKSANLREVRDAIRTYCRRIRLGELSSSRDQIMGDGRLDRESVAQKLLSHDLEMDEKASKLESDSQRHATINMFVSTIVPSFIIFSFLGSTIISGSVPGLFLFGIGMVIVLPFVYSLSFAALSRRLLE